MNTPPPMPSTINTIQYPKEFQQVILEKSRNFVGRDFVFTAFANFLQCYNQGYFTIIGVPGSGKSAILAKYITDNPTVVYYNAQITGKNCVEEFFYHISTQITQTFAVDTLHTTSLNAILQQASDQLKPHQKLIIAIDALDAVKRNSQAPGSNIFYLPRYLPKKVYFLLTRRPFLKEKSGLLSETPIQIIDLNDYTKENLQDVQTYIQQKLALKPRIKENIGEEKLIAFIIHLANASENNFMYASEILSVIADGFSTDTLHATPKLTLGLKNYYQSLWQTMQGDGLSDLALDILRLLIKKNENQQGFSIKNITKTLDADEFDVEEILDDLVEFLQHQDTGDEVYYRLFHSSFGYWLLQMIGFHKK